MNTLRPLRPLRPLGPLSNFVVENLPGLLEKYEQKIGWQFHARDAETRKSFIDEFTQIVRTLLNSNEVNIELDRLRKSVGEINISWRPNCGRPPIYSERDLALIDLKFLNQAYYHLTSAKSSDFSDQDYMGSFFPELFDLVNEFRSHDMCDRPLALTYEELVMINPHCDMRMFSTNRLVDYENFKKDDRAHNEFLFLSEHQFIENHLLKVIDRLLVVKVGLSGKEPAEVDPILIDIAGKTCDEFLNIFTGMHVIYRKLNPTVFAEFRNYYSSLFYVPKELQSPVLIKGASGAFTGSIPIIQEILGYSTGKGTVDIGHIKYLSSNIEYFPNFQKEMIQLLLEGYKNNSGTINGSIESLIKKFLDKMASAEPGDEDHLKKLLELQKKIDHVNATLLQFRKQHLHMIRAKLSPGVTGTGSENDTDKFLTDRIKSSPR